MTSRTFLESEKHSYVGKTGERPASVSLQTPGSGKARQVSVSPSVRKRGAVRGRASGRSEAQESFIPAHILSFILFVLTAAVPVILFFDRLERIFQTNILFFSCASGAILFCICYYFYRIFLLAKAESWLNDQFLLSDPGEAPPSVIGDEIFAFFEKADAVHERGAAGAMREARHMLWEGEPPTRYLGGALITAGFMIMFWGLLQASDFAGGYADITAGLRSLSIWRNQTHLISETMYAAFGAGFIGAAAAFIIGYIDWRAERLNDVFYHTLSRAVSKRLRIFYQKHNEAGRAPRPLSRCYV